jgi:hypothetical protein
VPQALDELLLEEPIDEAPLLGEDAVDFPVREVGVDHAAAADPEPMVA